MTRHRRPRLPRRAAAGLAVAALLVGACGESDDHPGEEPTDGAPTAEPTAPEEPGDDSGDDDGDLPPEVDAAVADLAGHLDVDASDITVVSYAAVTWPDGSIGCPEPGHSYTQALVPGSRLVLAAEGSEYFYHAGRERDLARCDRAPQSPVDQATS